MAVLTPEDIGRLHDVRVNWEGRPLLVGGRPTPVRVTGVPALGADKNQFKELKNSLDWFWKKEALVVYYRESFQGPVMTGTLLKEDLKRYLLDAVHVKVYGPHKWIGVV